jgi:uncharacterized lipoprotein YajG
MIMKVKLVITGLLFLLATVFLFAACSKNSSDETQTTKTGGSEAQVLFGP